MAPDLHAGGKETPPGGDRQQAEYNIRALGSEFAIAQEWGLFPLGDAASGNKDAKTIILESLNEAETSLKAGEFITVNQSLLKGRAALNQAQFSRPYWYIGNNRFGFLPLVFTTISTASVYYLVFVFSLKLSIPDVLHHPAFLGLSGAVLKSLYWLQYQINKGLLRPRWFAYFLVAPFIGVILGGIAALIVNVGFRLTNGAATTAPDWKTVGLVAAFAGFNWEWALDKFRIGADAVSSRLFEKK